MPSAIMWLGVPLLGGVIGYVTNRIAVRMIFRPIQPVYVLGFRVQGLIGRRQAELADNIGRVVGDHLVHHKDLVDAFGKIDFQELLGSVLDNAIGPKIQELRAMPFVGGLLTEERVDSLRRSITGNIVAHQDRILEALEQAIEDSLDVQGIVRERVAAFPVEKLESLVLGVAARELRAIEALGAVLGTLIGVIQVFLIWGFA